MVRVVVMIATRSYTLYCSSATGATVSPWRLTVHQNISATDGVVKRLGLLLQRWALAVGFDFHGTEQGGFFRITHQPSVTNVMTGYN